MENTHSSTRTKILFAAKKLFSLQGYEATSVRQICDEAGINCALISYHFGGKESVFFALFDTFFPTTSFCNSEKCSNPVIGLKTIMEKLIRFKVEQPEMVSIIQQEILKNSPRIEGMSQYMYPIYLGLRTILEEGKSQGLFKFNSLDHALLLIMPIMTFPSSNDFIKPLLTGKRIDTENILSESYKFILNGLGYIENTLSDAG